jgi:hypothetical protein
MILMADADQTFLGEPLSVVAVVSKTLTCSVGCCAVGKRLEEVASRWLGMSGSIHQLPFPSASRNALRRISAIGTNSPC